MQVVHWTLTILVHMTFQIAQILAVNSHVTTFYDRKFCSKSIHNNPYTKARSIMAVLIAKVSQRLNQVPIKMAGFQQKR
jgi:hypothetical protein